jgi:hypothetical protein
MYYPRICMERLRKPWKLQPRLWRLIRDSNQTHPEHYSRVLPSCQSAKSELCRIKAMVMWCNMELPRQLSFSICPSPYQTEWKSVYFTRGQADRWNGTAEEANSHGCCPFPTLQYDRGVTGALSGMEPRGGEGQPMALIHWHRKPSNEITDIMIYLPWIACILGRCHFDKLRPRRIKCHHRITG